MSALVFHPGICLPVVSPIDDGLNPLSTVSTISWNTDSRISASQETSWNIIAYGINVLAASAFNTRLRLHVTGWIESSGVVHPIVFPVDYKTFIPSSEYHVEARLSLYGKSAFRLNTRISAKRAVLFDCHASLHAHAATGFNLLSRVYAPGFASPSWVNQVSEPVVKPIAKPYYQTPSYIEWNDSVRIRCQKTIRFNDTVGLSVPVSVRFNDDATEVICLAAIAWDTLMRI